MGTEEVTTAGITVDQEVALVTAAAWEGDGTTSGLMGLAYPALSVFFLNQTSGNIETDVASGRARTREVLRKSTIQFSPRECLGETPFYF
jgi:hypothetical protein